MVGGGALAGGLLGVAGSGSQNSPPLPVAAAAFSHLVIASTQHAGTATMAFRYRDEIEGGCIPDTNSSVHAGHGTIDFVDHSASFVETTTGCNAPPASTRWRSTNGVQYFTFDRSIPGYPMNAARPWASTRATGARARPVGVGLSGAMTSNEPLRVLLALRGRVHRIGPRSVDGVPAVAYRALATLASLEQATGAGPSAFAPAGPNGIHLEPAARTIPIRVEIWVDRLDRVREVSAREPLYTGIYKGGADTENAAQVATVERVGELRSPVQTPARPVTQSHESALKRAEQAAAATGAAMQAGDVRHMTLPLVHLRPQSALEVRVVLSDFGKPVHLVAPSSRKVVHLPAH